MSNALMSSNTSSSLMQNSFSATGQTNPVIGNMSSTSSTHITSGSRYGHSGAIYTNGFVSADNYLQEQQTIFHYTLTTTSFGSEDEDRGGDDYPPIGQLVPIGDAIVPMLIFAAAYLGIKMKRLHKAHH